MNLDDLPEATKRLHDLIVDFEPVAMAMEAVLRNFDVTEAAVRARFEAHYRITPEELATRHTQDNSIDGYIREFKRKHSDYHPSRLQHAGERFYFIVDDKKTGKEVKRWYRFLIHHGLMAVIIDEVTHTHGDVLDPLVLDDIARQIGWKRWSHWPDVGRQPSKLFGDKRYKPIVSQF